MHVTPALSAFVRPFSRACYTGFLHLSVHLAMHVSVTQAFWVFPPIQSVLCYTDFLLLSVHLVMHVTPAFVRPFSHACYTGSLSISTHPVCPVVHRLSMMSSVQSTACVTQVFWLCSLSSQPCMLQLCPPVQSVTWHKSFLIMSPVQSTICYIALDYAPPPQTNERHYTRLSDYVPLSSQSWTMLRRLSCYFGT